MSSQFRDLSSSSKVQSTDEEINAFNINQSIEDPGTQKEVCANLLKKLGAVNNSANDEYGYNLLPSINGKNTEIASKPNRTVNANQSAEEYVYNLRPPIENTTETKFKLSLSQGIIADESHLDQDKMASIEGTDPETTSKSINRTVNITQPAEDFKKFSNFQNVKLDKPNRNVNMISDPLLEERPYSSWAMCRIFDAKFQLQNIDISNLESKRFTFNNALHFIVRNNYKNFNNICEIQFKSTRKVESGYRMYGYCQHYSCCLFLFKMNSLYEVEVFRNQLELTHNSNVRLTSQCRNIAREIMQHEMEHIRPFNMYIKNTQRSSEELCKVGNLQFIKSKTTLRKMNSQRKARLDYTKEPFYDIYQLQLKTGFAYIKELKSPLSVYFYTKELLEYLFKNNLIGHTLFFDASGKFIGPVACAEKRIFIYEMVAHVKSKNVIIPVAGMISSRHRAYDIQMFLSAFRDFCESIKVILIIRPLKLAKICGNNFTEMFC